MAYGGTIIGPEVHTASLAPEYAQIWVAYNEFERLFGDNLDPTYTVFEDPVGIRTRFTLCNGLTVTFTSGIDYLDDDLLAFGGRDVVGWDIWDRERDERFGQWATGNARDGMHAAKLAVEALVANGMAEATGSTPAYKCTYVPVITHPERPLAPVRFYLGEPDPVWDGLTDGTYWNGYANVWVTPDTMTAIRAWLDRVEPGAVDPDEMDADITERTDTGRGLVCLANGWTAVIVGDPNNATDPELEG